MSALRSSSRWLAVAAFAIVGQALVSFTLDPSLINASFIAVSVFFARLLLRGSRFAWSVVLIGAVDQLVSSAISAEHLWSLAAGGIVSICLLAPPSVRFTWIRRPQWQAGKLQLRAKTILGGVKVSAYGVVAQLAGWGGGEFGASAEHRQRSYRLLIWRLGVACVLLFVLAGATYNWQQGSGRNTTVVNVVTTITWDLYALVQLAFIAVSLRAAYQHFTPLSRHDLNP